MIGPIDFEGLDAVEDMALFELCEAGAARALRVPRYMVEGIENGRLRRHRALARRVSQRLALRAGDAHTKIVLRCEKTGAVVRLPFA